MRDVNSRRLQSYGRLQFYKPLGDQNTYYSKCGQVYDLKHSLCCCYGEVEESSSLEFGVIACMRSGGVGPLCSTPIPCFFCHQLIQKQQLSFISLCHLEHTVRPRDWPLMHDVLPTLRTACSFPDFGMHTLVPSCQGLVCCGTLAFPSPHSGCPALHLSLRPGSPEGNPTFPSLGFLAAAKGV